MVKRTIQTSKPGFIIGIEYDNSSIRSAKMASDGRGTFTVDRLEEVRGNFSEDAALMDGLRQIKSKLNSGFRDTVVSCLTGKQVFASQIDFRKLAPEEMEQALRLELRKTVHFEVATSTIDYQILSEDEGSSNGSAKVMVALASNSVLKRQLMLLEKSGLKAAAVDVLPVAVANALWMWTSGSEQGHPIVALHIGSQTSTIVIDGEHSPFFNRNVYFAAEDAFGPNSSETDRKKQLQSLADEVSRSMAFYEKNSDASGFQEVVLLGEFLDGPHLTETLVRQLGLPVNKMDLPGRMGSIREPEPGRFDLAVALALRGDV